MPSFTTSTGRQPRGLVKINGSVLQAGLIDFEVVNNAHGSADTFHMRLSAGALDQYATQTNTQQNTAWFLSQQDQYVELFIGFPQDVTKYGPADLTSWIYGQADDMEFDLVRGIVTLAGRDMTRLFIDTKTTQKWPNQTSSQIATALASKHGLATAHITKTTTLAGKYYSIDHVNLTDERSEWDLLQYLAEREDFTVFVRGTALYFQPKATPQQVTPYPLVWTPPSSTASASANFIDIRMKRALTVSRGIQVVIRSWNHKQAKGFVKAWPPTGKVKSIAVGKSTVGQGAQVYVKTIPNLSTDDALQKAKAWYSQLVSHEMKIDVDMPGDNSLDTTSIISLTGTNTSFDQTYYPNSITRTYGLESGYSMRVAAKNHSPDSEVSA